MPSIRPCCCYRCSFSGLLRLLFRWGIYTQQNKWNQLFCIPDIDHHRYLIHHERWQELKEHWTLCHSDSQLWELKFMMSSYMAPLPSQRWQERWQNASQESFGRILINKNVYSSSFYNAAQINENFFSKSVYDWLTLDMEKSIQMRNKTGYCPHHLLAMIIQLHVELSLPSNPLHHTTRAGSIF